MQEYKECITDSIIEVEYVAAIEAAKEVVWLKKFLFELGVVLQVQLPIILYCESKEAIAQSKDLINHKCEKHIERKYHLVREIIRHEDVVVAKVTSINNLEDPFTKTLTSNVFQFHLDKMGVRCNII